MAHRHPHARFHGLDDKLFQENYREAGTNPDQDQRSFEVDWDHASESGWVVAREDEARWRGMRLGSGKGGRTESGDGSAMQKCAGLQVAVDDSGATLITGEFVHREYRGRSRLVQLLHSWMPRSSARLPQMAHRQPSTFNIFAPASMQSAGRTRTSREISNPP